MEFLYYGWKDKFVASIFVLSYRYYESIRSELEAVYEDLLSYSSKLSIESSKYS